MFFVYFAGCNSEGYYQECSLGSIDLDFCLDMLSALVREGWQFYNIQLSDCSGHTMRLPVEAFDGEPLEKPLQSLHQEWEEILFHNQ